VIASTDHRGLNVVIGAGLTGLAAAYVLNNNNNYPVIVFEAESYIGGEARTIVHNGFRFDLGTHRFYTRNREVLDIVGNLLAEDLLTVQRSTQIYLQGKLVNYPLDFFNALSALGPALSIAAATSYCVESIKRYFSNSSDKSFEDWIISHFGRVLYEIYFRPYSEKVWGIPCKHLKADFAVQRIKGLSFREAVINMFWRSNKGPVTLERQFLYPRLGFGQIPEKLANALPQDSVKLQSSITRIEHDNRKITNLIYMNGDAYKCYEPANIISTMPISCLIGCMFPVPPKEVVDAALRLKYRDQIFTLLMLNGEHVTLGHWIYFPGDDLFFSRIHEPKNWSSTMSPPGKTSLVAEIFCNDNESIWTMPDEELIKKVSYSLAKLGIINEGQVIGGHVVHLRKAYPLYVDDYKENLEIIFDFLSSFNNLQVAGRDGMFKYTSGDYCIEMGIKAAENLMGYNHDLRNIASEKIYAET
jgi:protoporphyrinogen oxidase